MGEIILQQLQEHKEKLLFGFVVLLILLIVLQAPIGGAALERIDVETRAKATAASKVSGEDAERLIKQIGANEVQRQIEVPDAKVSTLFFDNRAGFKPAKPSAWQLGSETFEKLPPLNLNFPGFPQLNDFDIPAGGAPASDRILGYVPRDRRKVTLVAPDVSEFKPGGGG